MGNQRPDTDDRVVDVLRELVAHFGSNVIIALPGMAIRSGETFQVRDGFDIPNDDLAHTADSTCSLSKSPFCELPVIARVSQAAPTHPSRLPEWAGAPLAPTARRNLLWSAERRRGIVHPNRWWYAMAEPSPAEIIRQYLVRMGEIRGTGGATKETSYYSAIENLLNQFGRHLKPKVICNGQLRNEGAGNPDFGIYTKSQIQGGEPRKGQMPERGVIEVKGLADQTWQTAKSPQATKYFDLYRLVLITNYREFRLIGEDKSGKAIELDRYTIAKDEATFWSMTAHPGPISQAHAVHFDEFLRRVMMTKAPLVKAQDIAWFLASYAKDAFKTINEKDATALDPLRNALELALGLRFEGEEGDHFFKSTLIQTLFYGVFSAWVVYAKQNTARFD
jgi:hypothetical protein